jgi:hypothetical protein
LLAEDFRGQPGQREQPVGALLIGQDPAERRKRQCVGVARMMSGFGGNCQNPR